MAGPKACMRTISKGVSRFTPRHLLPGIKCLGVNLETPLEIVRMHAFGPAISHFLFYRATSKFQPWFVEEGAELVQARHPDQHRRRVGHGTKTNLALQQRCFSQLAPSDIARNAAHPGRLAFAIELDAPALVQPAYLPIRQEYPVLRVIFHASAQRVLHSLEERVTIVRVYCVSESVDVELLRRREAKQGPPFFRNPDLITHDVPHPDPEFGSAGG